MQHFRMSIFTTIVLLLLAAFWGYHLGGMAGAWHALMIATILGVMEISLSFDNAVVNATVLRSWNPFWQKMFLTIGIVVAVFGMRLLFPLLIVAVATGQGLLEVWLMALNQPQQYAHHLSANHAGVAAFGGAFLLLVCLNFLFDQDKQLHWLGRLEQKLGQHGSEGMAIFCTLIAILVCVSLVPEARKLSSLTSGITGILVYVAVKFISTFLEQEEQDPAIGKLMMGGSIGGFLYLEVLDASFSFDGVIGSFAISNDVVIIMLGLAIGAMFVRSLTVFLVNQGTLDQYVYLEHGAHYAIGVLALIMLASVKYHVPEWLTGFSGVAFILLSLWSSVRYRNKQ
ncbi:MAG: hypothetical protein RL748_3373 [Pseudomonadota bacterium]|jgi:hypothetical protein